MTLKEDGLKNPIFHSVIIILFAVGAVSMPYDKLFCRFITDETVCKYLSLAIPRLIVSAVAIALICKYGFSSQFKRASGCGFLALIPAFIVCVNNFPFIGIITGNAVVTASFSEIMLYLLYCVSVGLFEETVFRGIVFPLCLYKLKDKKYGLIFATALSSALFGATHIINLFSGLGIGACLLQIGYSFLIGALCAAAVLWSKNIFSAVFLHTVYDIGGMLLSVGTGIASGFQWDAATVIITAVLGVGCAIWTIYKLLKTDKEEIVSFYFPKQEKENTAEKS